MAGRRSSDITRYFLLLLKVILVLNSSFLADDDASAALDINFGLGIVAFIRPRRGAISAVPSSSTVRWFIDVDHA